MRAGDLIGMGKRFAGVYHLLNDEVMRFAPGKESAEQEVSILRGAEIDSLNKTHEIEMARMREEMELVRGAGAVFSLEEFLKGQQSPVFFGSGINNFGVREVLRALVDWAPPPQPREAVLANGSTRLVDPSEPAFTGFVFKIQANMDPQHRDRIAFLRVCSGQYRPGMKARHGRLGREMKIANAVTFMANERSRMEEAYAGDIIGIHNHGQLQIGDVLSEGVGSLSRASRISRRTFSRAHLRDPLRAKQLNKGLIELGEEGDPFSPRWRAAWYCSARWASCN